LLLITSWIALMEELHSGDTALDEANPKMFA
jgi:hypothetical protein